MGDPRLDWADIDPAHLFEWLNRVSRDDGILSFMFGGHGQYFKVVRNEAGVFTPVTAETAERLVTRGNRTFLGWDTKADG